MRHRLTALLANLLLLPSTVIGGGDGCVMGSLVVVNAELGAVGGRPPAHDHSHDAHLPGGDAYRANIDALVHEADTGSPHGVPHSPERCVLAVGCGAAVIATAVTPIEEPLHVSGRVNASVVLTPDSPAPGLEPPPPRA